MLHFYSPKHDVEQSKLRLVALHVSQMASGWSLANESYYGVQAFYRQSEALDTRDFLLYRENVDSVSENSVNDRERVKHRRTVP